MGHTEKETDFWGNEKEVHYDDSGHKVGETRYSESFWGNKSQEHYDTSGNKIGETRREEGFFGDKAVHYDTRGNKIGSSKNDTTFFGAPIQRHYDNSGNQVGKSHYEEKFWGGHRKVHEGEYFKGDRKGSSAKHESGDGPSGGDYTYGSCADYGYETSTRSIRPPKRILGTYSRKDSRRHILLNRSTQFIRLHLATAIISLSILPLAGFFWLLSTYPGLMETPTIYPDGIPAPLILIGVILIWLLSPLPWLLADKLIDLSKLNSLGSGLGWPVMLVGILHICGGVITTFLGGAVFTSSFDAQTSTWLLLTISCCAFPAGIASVLWILIGYPISLVRTILRQD